MRIPIEVEADLLTLDLTPMSSPKHNAHIQGCPRTMYKMYTVGGNVVYNSSSYRGEPIKLGKSGMYIVRCNKYCFKILIK